MNYAVNRIVNQKCECEAQSKAEFLKLVTAGKREAVNTSVGNSYRSTVTESEYEDEEDKETEDFDDEEN